MRTKFAAIAGVFSVGACCAAGAASASDYNPVGVYVGAGIGQSNVRSNGYYSSSYYGIDNRNTAWQLTLGVRPISPFGVEYDYIDFGSPNGRYGSFYSSGSDN